MKTKELVGYHRTDLGTKYSKLLRVEGNVPCVIYGGEEHVHFYAPMILFKDIIYSPEACQVLVNVEGKEYTCIVQDSQYHPVSEMLFHVDLLELVEGKPVKMDIPIKFTGVAPGVQQGGKFVQKLRTVKVKGVPANLPDEVIIDISKMGLGKSVKVADAVANGFEILGDQAISVATIKVPRGLVTAEDAAKAAAKAPAKKGAKK